MAKDSIFGDTESVYDDAAETPIRILERFPRPVGMAVGGLLVVGVVAFIAALIGDATRAWQAYLFNWLFWTTIAQGAVMFAVAVHLARGVWARPVRRISLSLVAFLPVALVLMLPLFFVGEHIFTWYGEDLHGKEAYLNMPFLAARNIITVGALTVLSLLFAYWALRPDVGELDGRVPPRLRRLYQRLSRGWQGQEPEEMRSARRMSVLAPIIVLVWAVAYSIVAWDFVMSNEEHWYSTLIGPYFFMGGFLGGIAATALLAVIYRAKLNLRRVIQAPQFHDLGKLTFAFCIFWAYLFWSQYIVIWYGLLPWEQTYLVHRLQQPYIGLAFLVFFTLFVIPFATLLGAAPKKTPEILAVAAGIVLLGLWVERYILVYPSFYPPGTVEALPFGWQEVGTSLAFAALFVGSIVYFATRFPIVQLWLLPSDLEHLARTEEPPGTETVTAE